MLAIPMYLHRKMLDFPVAMNPKELVGDMSKLSLLVKIYGRKCHPSLRDSGKKNLP